MGQKRGELFGDYQRRMRDEIIAGSRGRARNPSPRVNSSEKPFYYSGRSYEPELTRAEIVMESIDTPLAVTELVISLTLLVYVPALGLINCAMAAGYIGSRMYHHAFSEQIGKPIDDFLVNTWQKFSKPRE